MGGCTPTLIERMMSMSEVRIGVDTGGTFTDVLAYRVDGSLFVAKTPSTPDDPTVALLTGVRQVTAEGRFAPSDVVGFSHGTTVALNAVLQKQWPPLGFVVTRGYREMIEIARQTVPGDWGAIYAWVKPPRVVPLENVREVSERMSHKGEVLEELNEQDVRDAARFYKERGINAVALCFLHSYVDPAHERRAREVFLTEHPECFLTISTDVLPEFREYERAMTTCLNAALTPLVKSYLSKLSSKLKSGGIEAPLMLMRSSGGLAHHQRAVQQPASIAYSGPSAGVLGMAWLADKLGEDKVLTYDMGGTSTDVALVENGQPLLTNDGLLDIYPMGMPSIDMVSIGAGGGSIVTLGTADRIRVGPESAGAVPGPVCYGLGGTEPTVTDANIVLGRIPSSILGGEMELDANVAQESLAAMGSRVGMGPEEFAYGVLQLAAANMAGAVRQVSIKRGYDPREFTLFAFGGAGPLHAPDVAGQLGIRKIVVPPNPGLGSCIGLLAGDIAESAVQTVKDRFDAVDPSALSATFDELEARVRSAVESQTVDSGNIIIERAADLCYVGMSTEITVDVPDGAIGTEAIATTTRALHDEHRRLYGYDYEGEQAVELVNLRVKAVVPIEPIELSPSVASGATVEDADVGTRDVYWGPVHGWIPTTLYDRDRLGAGHELSGPAIVTEYDSTVLLPPGATAAVDVYGDLIIHIATEKN